jgi:hypothetical protein
MAGSTMPDQIANSATFVPAENVEKGTAHPPLTQ